ncbi:MAG: hypothetical protein QOE54_6476 [Streptosporangiaceae bacterium]|nr:hypothetical protein [Streptosporangiaceae bacterium]MDX6434110.1 hypothetical protein [Streptosporangiaceae bacterium]
MTEGPDTGLVVHVGSLDIDVPRSAGFYGGVALAVAVGLIDPPLGLFIAAVPLLKMLTSSRFPTPVRFVGQFLEGSAKPVGGDAEGTVRLQGPGKANGKANGKAKARPARAHEKRPRPSRSAH